jgi:hypothetical protein
MRLQEVCLDDGKTGTLSVVLSSLWIRKDKHLVLPEPSTRGLLLAGWAGLLAVARHKRR